MTAAKSGGSSRKSPSRGTRQSATNHRQRSATSASTSAVSAPVSELLHSSPPPQQQQQPTRNNKNNSSNNSKKNVDNTVFVRFVPPSNIIRRHHVEELFSQCGPIKKSSIIHAAAASATDKNEIANDDAPVTISRSYGFVKYTTPEDAQEAARQLNHRSLTIDGITITVKVELAQAQPQQPQQSSNEPTTPSLEKEEERKPPGPNNTIPQSSVTVTGSHGDEIDPTTSNKNDIKKTNRLILRNLSFYAKEADIRKALQSYGNIVDIHIPKVAVSPSSQPSTIKGKVVAPTHRGFAFVTFEKEQDTEALLQQSPSSILIKERTVQISRSMDKTAYTNMQQQQQGEEKVTIQDARTRKVENLQNNDADDIEADKGEDDANDNEDQEDEDDDSHKNTAKDDTAIAEGRCLFVRNLPFDCTRHDIFDTFRTFGYITSIFIVKTESNHSNDHTKTLLPKGTAFVTFQKQEPAKRALKCANPTVASSDPTTNFISQRTATSALMGDTNMVLTDGGDSSTTSGHGIVMKGRRLLVDLALDKETASTLIGGEKNADKVGYKDKRNLYLKNEGRVDNNEAKNVMTWDELPEGDKLKRQTAWSEKNTKLRSPLFYINPNRLSIRNLGKHIDEVALKKLIVTAIRHGLYENRLVQPDDQIAHWRASGEYTTREILAKIQEGDTLENGIIPPFDEKNIKQSIPSLHIHRDVVSGGNKNIAPSRGFGFVEFQHHAHALACLRELNNNSLYSKEYAIGGKQVALMKERRKRTNSGKKRKVEPPIKAEDGTTMGEDNYVTADGNIRTPRLIVEFTVENKAKAKQQAEHKAKQQANQMKQRMDLKSSEDVVVAAPEKVRKSRGAIQREKKRQRQQQSTEGDDNNNKQDHVVAPEDATASSQLDHVDSTSEATTNAKKKARSVAPPKKPAKLDADEVTFSNLVASYQQQADAAAAAAATSNSTDHLAASSKPKRRWYD